MSAHMMVRTGSAAWRGSLPDLPNVLYALLLDHVLWLQCSADLFHREAAHSMDSVYRMPIRQHPADCTATKQPKTQLL